MKFNLKNISFILVIVLTVGVLAACTPQEQVQNNEVLIEDLILATGYLESTSMEYNSSAEIGNKYYAIFDLHKPIDVYGGDNLKLEVEDKELFDSLEEDEFYIFSYNENNIIRAIDTDYYLKGLVENSMVEDPDDDHPFLKEIVSGDKISTDGLTLLDEYIIDFNGDGYEEIIGMYVAAERDDNGEIMWDDGQRWVLVVHVDNKDYVLYDDYVQLGSIQFNVFTADDDFNIVTKSVRTASLDLSQYKYNETNDSFILTIPYSVGGNVNMLYSSK